MKIEELRIGNWLYFPFHNENVKVDGMGIISSDYKTTKVQFTTIDSILMEPIDTLRPILLTSTFLTECGFSYDSVCFSKGNFYLGEYTSGFKLVMGSLSDSGIVVEYVHQLQNLYFAITGIELEINDVYF